MNGRSARRLVLLIAAIVVLYFVLTSATVYTMADNAAKAVKGLFGLTPSAQVVDDEPPPGPAADAPPQNIIYHAAETGQPDGSTRVTLYFADPDGVFLVPVTRTLPLTRSPIRDSLSELIRGPLADSGLASPFFEMAVRDLALRADGTLRVDIPTQIVQASTGWGSAGSIIALESLIRTVSEYEAVEQVQFLTGGKVAPTLFHGLVADEPFAAQKWLSTDGRMTLYYAIFAGSRAYLVPDQVEVAATDQAELMRLALEGLKQGKTVGEFRLHPTLPANVNVLDVSMSGRTAVINLSGEFGNILAMEPARQALLLDSLVLTLTSFPGVKQVQLLVEGEAPREVVGKYDLAKPLGRPRWLNPE